MSDEVNTGFEIDHQTLKDIGILDEGGLGPVLKLFDRAKTPGGRGKLEKLLLEPLADIRAIREQSFYIEFFGKASLHISRKEMDMIEHYQYSRIPVWPDQGEGLWLNRLRYWFKDAPAFYTVTASIDYIVAIIRRLYPLQDSIARQQERFGPGSFFSRMLDLLGRKEIRNMIDRPDGRRMSFREYSEADHFLRSNFGDQLKHLLGLVYDIDAYTSVYTAARQHKFVVPEFLEQEEAFLEIRGLFQPFIKNPVPNSLLISQDKNLCLITGANMSGKSTFMKSFALCVYLAHIGFPVPAEHIALSVFSGLLTTVNLPDNTSLGHSHFYSEVNRIKTLALAVKNKKKMVAVLDEMFRGTNTEEAVEASVAVIASLVGIRRSLAVVSSHLDGVADKLEGNPRIQFCRFTSDITSPSVAGSYQLQPGISREKTGMLIIRNEKILELLEELERTPPL